MQQKLPHNLFNNQAGQTLVETLVAALVLTMGISAAVGLSIFALGATTSITKQLVAIGLAREGIEAVKNMRDSNWLSTTLADDCYDFYSNTNTAYCYPGWLDGGASAGEEGPYNIDPNGGTRSFALRMITNNPKHWNLFPSPLVGNSRFGLDYSPENLQFGLYASSMAPEAVSATNSKIGRAITISAVGGTFPPFDNVTLGPRIHVKVDVWWADKRCPVSNGIPASSRCKVTLETYLTNWRNY